MTVNSTLTDAALPPPVVLTAYYVATEALTNVAKHAHATLVRFNSRRTTRELLLRITDDGVGGADQAGAGLSGLRDRIQALDGHLHVHSPHDAGTTVQARLPNHGTAAIQAPDAPKSSQTRSPSHLVGKCSRLGGVRRASDGPHRRRCTAPTGPGAHPPGSCRIHGPRTGRRAVPHGHR